MTKEDFIYTLQNPQSISFQQTEDLKSIINKHPYLQSARAIYLKGLKNQSSLKYNQELKITAAYTTDRSILFDFITSNDFSQNEISKHITKNTSNINLEDLSTSNLSDKSVENEIALKHQLKDFIDEDLFKSNKEESNKNISINPEHNIQNTKSASPKEILNLGKPLEFEKTEKHSFNEWLNITRFKPIDREEQTIIPSKNTEEKNNDPKAKKFELIDKFINANPKIDPTKTTQIKGNLAKAQMIHPESLMTETLARIYVEQKNYKSAIQSYKILSLKYPEKSSFFASQIQAIKQLQEQNKL